MCVSALIAAGSPHSSAFDVYTVNNIATERGHGHTHSHSHRPMQTMS